MSKEISNKRKVEEAHQRREEFIKLHSLSKLVEWKLVWTIWKEKDFDKLGFMKFGDYVEAPIGSGGLGISRPYAVMLALTYAKARELKVDEQQLQAIGPRKFYEIKDLLQSNDDEWLAKAENMSLEDLKLEKQGIDISNCDHKKAFMYCPVCKSRINNDN